MGHPPRLSRTTLVCLLLLFAYADSASKCTTGCHGMHPSKSYQEGHTYVYDLEGSSVTSVTDSQRDASLKLSATVELSVKPDCVHQLRLKNVQLNGAPPSKPEVEKYAVQFNYHGGHIDTELCTEPADSQASLNIKRAVVSMFQSAIMQDSGATIHHETDVFGACPTHFSFQKEGDSLLVHKNRNLAQCAYRENINNDMVSYTIDTAAGIKSSPLLASEQEVQQRFKRGILNKAVSKETYKLRPFSNANAGAKTIVETTLTLKNDKADNPAAAVSLPRSLIFESPHPVLKSSVDAINNALSAAKAEVAGGVKPEAASKFSDLVKVLRLSNKNDILSVYQKVRAGAGFDKNDQKLLLDALLRAGSGESAEVAVELIKNKEVSGVQALLFYASLAFVRHVHLPSVAVVTSLLDQPDLPRMGYLGIGQVIGKYCQDHNCENVPEVKEAVHKLRDKVGNGKSKTREQENLIIAALKALGNAQFLDDPTLVKLANIGADKNVRNRVRVAAIEALPARCSMKWKNILSKVLADREDDSEIRIKAYLSMVACPCPHVANQLKEVLDKETVNQVGSFIQSHLRNLRASTDPSKQEAKNHLGQIKPRTKFPEDFRKFSFNNELSYNMGTLGAGSTIENNVIYSQNSFVPRSANLNLTMELFGRSFNFLELETRVENLDRLIEHYFGPKGKIWETDLKDLPSAGSDAASKLGDYIKERYQKTLRGKREVKQGELDKFAKNVHLRGTEVDQDLELDMSVKLFGVELAYLSHQGDSSKMNAEHIVDKVFDTIDKGFNCIKNLNYDLENYLQFLDTELVYPTGLGSALTLGLTGSSAARLKTNGKLDIPAILKDPKNAAFNVALEPSVSVRIAGSMIVKGLGAEAGMKLVGTLHTATGTDLSVSMLNGKGIDINIGIPKKKQELISLSSEVLLSSGPKGNKYVAPKLGKAKEHVDCFDQFSPVLGLTVCGTVSYPSPDLATFQQKPLFPLNGPATLAVSVNNDDVSSYHFKVFMNVDDPKKRTFEILLDTPKSKVNRRMSVILEAGLEPNMYIKASLDSPIKKISLEGALKNTAQERTLTITASHDTLEYYGRVGVLASGSKYKPVLEYKVPEHIEKLVTAKTGISPGQQYNVQGTVDVSDYQGGQKFVLDKVAFVMSGQKLVVIDGSVICTPNILTVDTNLGYADNNLALKVDGKKLADKNYELAVSAKDTNIGFNLNWEFKKGQNELENKLVFIHGPDLNSEINRLTLEQGAVYKMDPKDFVLSTSNELNYPVMLAKLKFDGKLTRKSISSDIEIKYDKFKLGSELDVKLNTEKPGDYEVELQGELMENSIELKSKRSIVDPHKSKYTNSLVMKLSPGGKYYADATLTYAANKNNVNVKLEGDMDLDGKKIKVDSDLEANPQSINSRASVKMDGVKYVEFLLRSKKTPNPSGNLNLVLKNYLTATGQFTYQNGKGSANLNIDIPKINRKIKANGDITVSGSEHVGNLEVLYDAEKDRNKRIKLSTISDITKTSVDTRNVLEILSYKFELNGKGTLQRTLTHNKLQMDIDVTLPNERFIVYKLNSNSVKKDSKYDIQADHELVDHVKKGGESRKLAYSMELEGVDLKAGTFNSKARLKFVNMNGKDVQVAWAGLNRVLENAGKSSEANLDISGSYMPKKFQFQLSAIGADQEKAYKVKSSLGDDLALMSSGSYQTANNKIEGVLDMKLPCEKLSNLKLQLSDSFIQPTKENDMMESSSAVQLTYNNDKTIKMQSYLKRQGPLTLQDANEGIATLTLNALQLPPMSFRGNYKYTPTEKKKTVTMTLNGKYGEKEATLESNNEYRPDVAIVNMNAKCSLPFEKVRNIDMKAVYKMVIAQNKIDCDVVLVADDVKYTMKGESQYLADNSLFHVMFTSPAGKTEVLSKFQKLGDKEYKGEWKVDTPKGFAATDASVNLESIDDFVINLNFDSDKMKHRKIHAEIANKPTPKTGKRIVITVTSDGQNIVTGSSSYKKRDEDGKIVVEGNGSLKVGENTRSSSFKYTRQQLTKDKDGEVGVAMVLNTNFGPAAIVGELKLSNKELHVFNSYCEQNKDCAHFKLQSLIDMEQKSTFKHQTTIEVDLRKFNVPAEFGLKTNTEYKIPVFDHTTNLYLHSTKDKTEYTWQLYIHPKESAAILTLPSREMATILVYDLPKSKQSGEYKLDLSVFLDRKNKPSDKTSLSASGDINIDQSKLSLSGETKFTYPNQPKDMIVKGKVYYGGEHLLDANLDIDIFAKKSQKITITANLQRQQIPNGYNLTSLMEVNSRGQKLKLDLKSHLVLSSKEAGFGSFFTYNDKQQKFKTMGTIFSADTNHIFFLVTLPDKELIKDEWKMEFSKNLQKIDRELSLLGNKPSVMNFEANDLTKFKLVKYSKENPNTQLSINGQIVVGQLAEVHADASKDGAKKELFHVLIHLDEEQFLKPDFAYNKENTIEAVDDIKSKYTNLEKDLKEVQEYVAKETQAETADLMKHLKEAQPNMKPLLEYYQTELNKLKNEISDDKTIKEIQSILNQYFGLIASMITETMKQLAENLQKLQEQINEFVKSLQETMKAVYPQLKASYEKIFRVAVDILHTAQNLATTYVKALLTIINEHQKELNELIALVSEMTQNLSKILWRNLGKMRQDIEEFGALLINQLKALPIYDIIKAKSQDLLKLQLPETVTAYIQEACNMMKAAMPTVELQQFLEVCCQYVVKHMKHEKVDEVSELKKVYSHSINALQSLLSLLQKRVSVGDVFNIAQFQAPMDFSLLSKLPGIFSVQLSVLNLLRNNELPAPLDVYYAYRPTLYPSDVVPPFSKSGVVTDGGHFFTFDGRHLTMPGTCTYILAQDMQNGNFSVVANFNEGVLISVTLTEPKESITLKNSGNILMNNKPAEFPANTKNLHAYLVQPFMNIASDYGVRVTCLNKPAMVCAVHVSGFYQGKLRGLLGDGNNEPYDDYTLPSGKITESATEFGNAYKLKADCPAANAVEHKERAPVCSEYFVRQDSPLQSCFNYVNTAQYRDACDHAVAAGQTQGPCLIATAYHYACYAQGILSTSIPPTCTNCKVGTSTIAVGDAFSVKVPKKEADIIFVVEQQSPNEKVFKEMIMPLMSELREELKHQGMSDVQIGLIGFSENMKWPQHYTLNGDTNIDGDVKNMKFTESKPVISLQEAKEGDMQKRVTYLRQRLDVELGTFKLTDAYQEAIQYPFRPGAAKAVVGVIANPCEKSPLPISMQQIRLLLGQKIYRDLGLSYYHMSFPRELLVSGKPQKNIVGYDKDSVYTFADSKKKPLAGSSDMKSSLVPHVSDVCADFAVSSGGAAFSSDNFLDAKPNQKKQFIQVAAKRIADGLSKLEFGKDCSCEYKFGLVGRSTCKIVDRKEK